VARGLACLASVLANSIDEGPAQVPEGQMLKWAVNPQTWAAPAALLQLPRQVADGAMKNAALPMEATRRNSCL